MPKDQQETTSSAIAAKVAAYLKTANLGAPEVTSDEKREIIGILADEAESLLKKADLQDAQAAKKQVSKKSLQPISVAPKKYTSLKTLSAAFIVATITGYLTYHMDADKASDWTKPHLQNYQKFVTKTFKNIPNLIPKP